jgi:SAM-dependent methyltransferase
LKSADELRSEFDQVARRSGSYPKFIANTRKFMKRSRFLPARCKQVLEIGCGKGDFARLLADRSDNVVALDLSPEMIRVASERSTDHPNIEFVVADIMTWDMPGGRFDCIVSFAALHHVPLRPALEKIKAGLLPGGWFITEDLYDAVGWQAAVIRIKDFINPRRLLRHIRRRMKGLTKGYWHHAENEERASIGEVREAYQAEMPGAMVEELYPFRFYSARWQKPSETENPGSRR